VSGSIRDIIFIVSLPAIHFQIISMILFEWRYYSMLSRKIVSLLGLHATMWKLANFC
jgi:hypothetical protein